MNFLMQVNMATELYLPALMSPYGTFFAPPRPLPPHPSRNIPLLKVYLLVGRSVCHNFLYLRRSYRSTSVHLPSLILLSILVEISRNQLADEQRSLNLINLERQGEPRERRPRAAAMHGQPGIIR